MEEYIAVCRKHWCIILGRSLLALLWILFFAQKRGNALYDLVWFGVPLFMIISAIIEVSTNYIGLTKTKIVIHKGIIKTSDDIIPLNKIQSVSIKSGLFGKIFGYYTIIIDHAGTGNQEHKLGHMVDGRDFVNVLEHMTGLR